MGMENLGKKAKNALRAAIVGGSLVSGAPADGGMLKMPPVPPTIDVLKARQADELAKIREQSAAITKNSKDVMDRFQQESRAIDANTKAVMDRQRQEFQAIEAKAKLHADTPEGKEEMRRLRKQFGLPEEE